MEKLTFKISSGLKNIIGRELITDKVIAIFELVKNSYDAGANKVEISFNNIYANNASITISDDGQGMNKDDIVNKWLFVAYSEKKSVRTSNYIDNINGKRTYAGAKGIGRFSCDRLGSSLKLYSKKLNDSRVNCLNVNWDDFEKNSSEQFIDISVKHNYVKSLPSKNKKGTSVIIENLREKWTRKDILDLKKSLIKLINPYENESDKFEIYLDCMEELENDKKQQLDRDKVNGKLDNYIFETLNLKTTQISVSISEDGDIISTKMFDRGTFLFELKQKSDFRYLKNVSSKVFYLNKAAKINFRKIMGVSPAEFGSIFVYKNGFRIMPYGEPGADMFDIDRRKAQGYNRFLGTRDIMGRIIVLGDNYDFMETSSRDGGFVRTKAYDELQEFFMKYVHVPLEKYVVGLISWGDESEDGKEAVKPEEIKSDIIKYITNYERKGEIISVNINDELFNIVEMLKSQGQSKVTDELKKIAQTYENSELDKIVSKIEAETKKIKKENVELTKKVEHTTEKLAALDSELKTTQKQVVFLKGLTNPKYENATESLHLMNTYAKSIKLNINNLAKVINEITDVDVKQKSLSYVSEIINAVQKINGTYTFAFSADYDISQHVQRIELSSFIEQYIKNALFSKTGEFIKIHIQPLAEKVHVKIDPLEFSMVIENLIYNSFKARAKNLYIEILQNDKDVNIVFDDDGIGIPNKNIDSGKFFELGYSTTNGTGVGLFHAKNTIEKIGGYIDLGTTKHNGFAIEVRLKNEH